MQIEVLAFWGFICLLLITFAELRQSLRMVGVIGCMLLVPMAFWTWDGVSIQTGDRLVFTGQDNTTSNTSLISFQNIINAENTSIFQNTTGNTSTIFGHNETSTKVYTNITTPFFAMDKLLSLVLLCMSIFGMVHYATLTRKGTG